METYSYYDSLLGVSITESKYISDYVIEFKFSDNTNKRIDFKRYIDKGSGGCNKYLNKDLFRRFDIIDGKDISWNDFEMSFPFISLYEGNLEGELV